MDENAAKAGSGMLGGGPAQSTAMPSETERAILQLEKARSQLGDTASRLAAKLKPVMRDMESPETDPEYAGAEGALNKPRESQYTAPLARAIDSHTLAVIDANRVLENVLNKLEV